jgi:NTE family protein
MQHIKNIVMEGGGVRGLAHIGALRYLGEIGVYQNLVNVGGTSVGALVGFHIALGYKSTELVSQLNTLDLTRFKDGTFKLYSLFSKFGMHKGDYLTNYLRECLLSQGLPSTATISQVGAHTGKWLSVVATNVNKGSSVIFNKDNDISIVKAIRMSVSLPFFFAAVHHGNQLYVDGALVNNYPLDLFDTVTTTKNGNDEVTIIDSNLSDTLGLRVDTSSEVAKSDYLCSNLMQFTQSMLDIVYDNLQDTKMTDTDWARTIRINTGNISTTDFGISEEQISWLDQQGYLAAKEYFEKRCPV